MKTTILLAATLLALATLGTSSAKEISFDQGVPIENVLQTAKQKSAKMPVIATTKDVTPTDASTKNAWTNSAKTYAYVECKSAPTFHDGSKTIFREYLLIEEEGIKYSSSEMLLRGKALTYQKTRIENPACRDYYWYISGPVNNIEMRKHNRYWNALVIEPNRGTTLLNCSKNSTITIFDNKEAFLATLFADPTPGSDFKSMVESESYIKMIYTIRTGSPHGTSYAYYGEDTVSDSQCIASSLKGS